MQKEPKLSEPEITYTRHIRFWSKGTMSDTAYKRYIAMKRKGKKDVAELLLSEWIVK